MVVALGPGKFYGSDFPRPRFYTDVKFGPGRVDPPVPVMDPLLLWADEAHWSMGGLSFKRLRLQGRIEGNIKKLRAQHQRSDMIKASKIRSDKIQELDEAELEESGSESEPEAKPEPKPETEEVVESVKEGKSRKRMRKLVDEFERVADADRVGYRTRSKKPGSDKAVEANEVKGRRTSPRKKKSTL